jgi:outer membrane protein
MTLRLIAPAAAFAAIAAAFVPAVHAQSTDTGNWIVRGRALYLDPANKDDTGLDLSVNSKVFPEVDISYFFTPNLAAELVLTYPQEHDVRAGGVNIGSLKHLPPTLSLQYHFTGMSFRPYVGAGLNYTHFSDVKLPPGVTIDSNSYGLALGAGVDVPMGGGWLFNVDVKKVQIKTEVSAGGASLGDFKVDPVLFSLGIGKRF